MSAEYFTKQRNARAPSDINRDNFHTHVFCISEKAFRTFGNAAYKDDRTRIALQSRWYSRVVSISLIGTEDF